MNKYIAIIVVIVAFWSPQFVSALTISPTKVEVAIDPGQTAIGEIELFNEESETKTFFTSFENFEPRGETGAPFFVGTQGGLATWMGSQASVTLAPGERVAVPYNITVPTDATPGGHFAAIFFGSQPPAGDGAGEVAIGGKVGTLILLRVNGEVGESGGVLEFGTAEQKRLFNSLPVLLSYRFNNTGGDRVVPRGEVAITNIFGMHVATLNANQTEGSVLPSSVRRFEVIWGEPRVVENDSTPSFFQTVSHQLNNFRFGIYSATMSLTWGETQQSTTTSFTLFAFPWQLLLCFVITLIVLFFVLRAYNRFIIARARR